MTRKFEVPVLGLSAEVGYAAARIRSKWDSRTEMNRRRKTAGLPPLRERTKTIRVYVTIEERAAIKAAAEAEGLPMSLFAVDAILEKLKANNECIARTNRTDSPARNRRLDPRPNTVDRGLPPLNNSGRVGQHETPETK